MSNTVALNRATRFLSGSSPKTLTLEEQMVEEKKQMPEEQKVLSMPPGPNVLEMLERAKMQGNSGSQVQPPTPQMLEEMRKNLRNQVGPGRGTVEITPASLATFLQLPPGVVLMDVEKIPSPEGEITPFRLKCKLGGLGSNPSAEGDIPRFAVPMHFLFGCKHWMVCWETVLEQAKSLQKLDRWPDNGSEVPTGPLPAPL